MGSVTSASMALTVALLRRREKSTRSAESVRARALLRSEPAPVPESLHRIAVVTEREIAGRRVIHLEPRTGASGPHVVYTHGGCYTYSLVAPHWRVLAALIRESGASISVPLYGLAPGHHVDEAYELLDELWREVTAKHERVFLAGDSAGGGLALGQALHHRDAGLPVASGVLLFSPWLDVTLRNPAVPEVEKVDPTLARAGLVAAGTWWAGALDPRSPRVSPLYGALDALPPVFTYQGELDILEPDAKILTRAITAVGGTAELRWYRGAFHVFVGATWTPESRRALRHAAQVIRGTAHRAWPPSPVE